MKKIFLISLLFFSSCSNQNNQATERKDSIVSKQQKPIIYPSPKRYFLISFKAQNSNNDNATGNLYFSTDGFFGKMQIQNIISKEFKLKSPVIEYIYEFKDSTDFLIYSTN